MLEGYREVMTAFSEPKETGNRFYTFRNDRNDALAYFVARDRGCAYAPMNGASISLGPRADCLKTAWNINRQSFRGSMLRRLHPLPVFQES